MEWIGFVVLIASIAIWTFSMWDSADSEYERKKSRNELHKIEEENKYLSLLPKSN